MRPSRRSHEPVVWALFGAGGAVAAFVLPAVVLCLGLLVPLGLFGEPPLDHGRVRAFAAAWPGGLVVFGVIALPAWHAVHRLYHLGNDLQLGARPLRFALCYGFAAALSVYAAALVAGF